MRSSGPQSSRGSLGRGGHAAQAMASVQLCSTLPPGPQHSWPGRRAASPQRGARTDLSRPQGCHGRLGAGGHVSQGRVVHAHAGAHGGRQCQALPERALGARRPVGVDRLLRTPTARKCSLTHLLVLCGWDAVRNMHPPDHSEPGVRNRRANRRPLCCSKTDWLLRV